MSVVLRSKKTQTQRYTALLKKYGTQSHLWDFGVPQAALTYAATHTSAEFLAAYPLWHLYQDAAGKVPACKINDPVGLCLDQGGGSVVLGAELFSDSTVTFTGETSRVSPGVYRVYTSTGAFSGVGFPGLTAGKRYLIKMSIDSIASVGAGIMVEGIEATAFSSLGPKQSIFTAISTTPNVKRAGVVLTDYQITIISVREVIGAHASQTNPLKRPILSNRYNILLNTETLSTQSVTTGPVPYVLSFTGTGTVTLSGTSTVVLAGTGPANRVSVTFTPTAGSLTLTVSGSVTKAQLEVV